MKGKRFVITGRVQGVGYRNFVETTAYDLDIFGEVWNRSDGAVECEAWENVEGTLATFERRLLTGPGHPERVSAMDIDGEEPPDKTMRSVRRP